MAESLETLAYLTPVSWKNVRIAETGFWGQRQEKNRNITLPIEYQLCKSTGRIDAFRLEWKPGQPNKPHPYWDSDVAKWIEAAAYSLAVHPDHDLEQKVEEVIERIASSQQEDGYLNSYYSTVAPQKRFSNLRDKHELYCAGHLIEAAVAYFEATGKRSFLDVMCKYAEYIGSRFGSAASQLQGYDGHEEIELALVKLYKATGNEKHLRLSQFFIDERGRTPHYFDREARARGEDPDNTAKKDEQKAYSDKQAHIPVREQTSAVGHAVRAIYLYTGMTDVAANTGDEELLQCCDTLWDNTTTKQMYITGGVGSGVAGERFTYDYDLPNEFSYNETCASVALVFWAHRMLQLKPDRTYADVMERALYNNLLGAVSLSGDKYYYANALAANPEAYRNQPAARPSVTLERQSWFNCACCPPNLARMIASLGGYVYSIGQNEIYAHLYIDGKTVVELNECAVNIEQTTQYPWKDQVVLTVSPACEQRFSFALRIPGWCRKATVSVNGTDLPLPPVLDKGYVKINRVWKEGDQIELRLDIPVERIEARPEVRMNCGKIALQRGPVVYCLEETDNGTQLHDLAIPSDAALQAVYEPDVLGGVVAVYGEGKRRNPSDWTDGALYKPETGAYVTQKFKAVPYYARMNRTPGEMIVWIRQM